MSMASIAARPALCSQVESASKRLRRAVRWALRHSQGPLPTLKLPGSAMLTVSRWPSSEVGWRSPTASEGMMMLVGRLVAVCRCRVIQPVEMLFWPGVPSSMNCIASKCDLLTTVDMPTFCTTASLPSCQISWSGAAARLSPNWALSGSIALGPLTGSARFGRAAW